MATRFEILLNGSNAASLRAAAEEAFEEIERLERQLSIFIPSSQLSHLNARAAREPVRVDPDLFQLLITARQLHDKTQGAFDITIAPLMRAWRFFGASGQMASPADLNDARSLVGMDLIQLNERNHTVTFSRDGVMLDLGGIAKGYAIERAAQYLREAGIQSALIHGGTSTVYGIGSQPDGSPWRIAIENPALTPPSAKPSEQGKQALAIAELTDQALSVSSPAGKFFQQDDQVFGHVIDPRTGQPTTSAILAAVITPSATEADAFSTGLLVLGASGIPHLGQSDPDLQTLLAVPPKPGSDRPDLLSHGFTIV